MNNKLDKIKISLKAARINAEMTAKEIGLKIGKSEKTILNWENGITPIPAEYFDRLCKIYKISNDYIQVPIVKDNFFCE